jgi:acetylornithine/succinyldiaminopimelate/putrescine aminotransferase
MKFKNRFLLIAALSTCSYVTAQNYSDCSVENNRIDICMVNTQSGSNYLDCVAKVGNVNIQTPDCYNQGFY